MVEVKLGKTSHLTRWTLYPREAVAAYEYAPVKTPDERIDGRDYRPESWHVICPRCGVLWATRVNVDMPNRNWQVKRLKCQACGTGTLWDAYNPAWNKSLPIELLHREMGLIKTWYDLGIRTYRQFWNYRHYEKLL